MIWLVFALLTGAAVMAVLAPLALRGEPKPSADVDVSFFKEQIAQISHDAEQGRLDPAEAEHARAEAARRLLRAQSAGAYSLGASRKAALIAALAAIAMIPAVSLLLYSRLGRPNQPDMPLEARLQSAPAGGDLAGAVAQIEQHLRDHPDDGRGFEVVAPYYFRTGRIDEAIHAYSEALRLLGPTADRQAALGEARLAQSEGKGFDAPRADFEAALALDSSNPKARYYLGLIAAQRGDREKAKDLWTKLLANAPPDAPYAGLVKRQLAGLDAATAGAPASREGEAIAALPDDERRKTIASMVERLAARLHAQGGDAEGWSKLIRAYSVLGEPEKARQALIDARGALNGSPAELERVEALARQLNIGG
jgi:cytochrome c-type biogenesis protein CcmH